MHSIDTLTHYGIPDAVIENWRSRGIESLLPFQQAAIRRHKLLEDGSLLVSAPTSSGKTLLGEIAAMHTARKHKKVLYLVPLKALAEEKFETFRELGQPQGLKVIISTRDHMEFDKRVAAGDFDIAVVIYEKFFNFVRAGEEFLANFGLVVLDELQLINDPERGPLLEMILTKLRGMENRPQLLGLSAVMPSDSTFPTWLGIPVLREEKRPVELRIGYLHEKTFHYWSSDGQVEDEEQDIGAIGEDKEKTLIETVTALVQKDEPCLVFVPDRFSSRRLAGEAAMAINGQPDDVGIRELEKLEESISRDELIEMMRMGAAFHNADLLLEERRVIEESFRAGRIKALFATSTLAMGVNLPAKNVFLHDQKWTSTPGSSRPFQTAVSKADMLNMGGRAGRLHLSDSFGRAIMIAEAPIDMDRFKYLMQEQPIEEFEPWLMKYDEATAALMVLGMSVANRAETIHDFLANSYSASLGSQKLTDGSFQQRLNREIDLLVKWGLVSRDEEGNLALTDYGVIAVQYGIRANTARHLMWAADSFLSAKPSVADVAFAALTTSEGLSQSVGLVKDEFYDAGPRYTQSVYDQVGYDYFKEVQAKSSIGFEAWDWVRICKSTLLLRDFTSGYENKFIEETYAVYFGAIVRLAEQASWLISAMAELHEKKNSSSPLVENLKKIAEQVRTGVPAAGLFLKKLGIRGLGRERIMNLVRFGVSSLDTLAEVSLEDLDRMTDKTIARKLFEIARRGEQAPSRLPSASDGSRKILRFVGETVKGRSSIEVYGKTVMLRESEFGLLLRLAIHRLLDESGWLDKYEMDLPLGSITQNIARLRESMRECTQDTEGWIQSNGQGQYRLALDPEEFVFEQEKLADHWSASVRQLAGRLRAA